MKLAMWVAILGCVLLGVVILGTVLWVGTNVLVACQCALSGERVTASVAEGDRYCTVVPIPKDWSVSPEFPVALDGLYRASAGGGVLFSLQNPDTAEHLALAEKYWIDLEHRGKIRIATEAEWEAAPEIPFPLVGTPALIKIPNRPEGLITGDHEVLSFNGYQLSKSGDIAMGGFWPPGDRYVLISSINGWCERNEKGFIGKAVYDGPFFIDIYSLWTGRKLAKIKGRWCNWTPDAALGNARWVSDRDLVFPFGQKKRDIIVCRFSE